MLLVIHGDLGIADLDSSLQVVNRSTAVVEDFKAFLVRFLFLPLVLFSFQFFGQLVVINFVSLFASSHLFFTADSTFEVSLLELGVFVLEDTHAVLSKQEVSLTKALKSIS